MMKRYIFNEREIEEEYRYIFLCGVKYGKKELCCIASILNIKEVSNKVFNKSKEMKVYIGEIKDCLQGVFMNTIGERTGIKVQECSIMAHWNVNGVYIWQIIGMSLYLFFSKSES